VTGKGVGKCIDSVMEERWTATFRSPQSACCPPTDHKN